MRHYKLEQHSKECELKKNNKFFNTETTLGELCEINPCNFIFYYNNEFILVSYHKCIEGFDHLAFKFELLKQLNSVEKKSYNVNRSIKYDNHLIKKAIYNFNTKISIDIINYTYFDNAGMQYCFTSKSKFMESYFNQESFDEEFKKTCEYLKNIGLDNKIPEVERLYELNKIYKNFSEVETIKQTEQLIKHIRKQLKPKQNENN